MSRDHLQDTSPIEDIDQLVDYFRDGCKPPDARGIGTEHEKFVYHGPDCSLIEFDGPRGIEAMFRKLQERFDWEPQYDRGRIVALVRGDEAITLEPGGQVELSGGVKKTIFETETEFDRHIEELAAILGDDYAAVSFGLNPMDGLDATGWIPKSRYDIMSRYLPTRGDLAHWMMKGTCTIQANLDYTSEEDAVDLMRTGVLVSPLVNALFANSPLRLGEHTEMQSYRGYIWTRTDPDRSGVPRFLYGDDWGFREWLEWVLDVPMFFIRRGDEYVDLAGHSFRDFWRDGYEGTPATMGDFELHLSTVFPEVRMKQFIEVRSADGGPREHIFALPALWKGIGYHQASRDAAKQLFAGVSPGDHFPLYAIAARDGIHGEWRNRRLADLARELVEIASAGLDAIAEEAGHPSEAGYLEPLFQILDTETSAADRLLQDYDEVDGRRGELIRRHDLLHSGSARKLPTLRCAPVRRGSSD
jgi:glutamate--cysteine ligase